MGINRSTYLEYLRKANKGELHPTNRLAGVELLVVRELIKEGLVSDSKERFLAATDTNMAVITPKGAITLSDWERDIKLNTWWYKAGVALTRFLWVLVGVLATLVAKLVAS